MMKNSLKLFIFIVGIFPPIGMGITLQDGTQCDDTAVACADGSRCVDVSSLCNYEKDCPDSSDEFNLIFCKHLSAVRKDCSRGQVRCTQSRSVYRYLNNECMDAITACKLGQRCLIDTEVCEGINVGKLMPVDHTQAKNNEIENLLKFIAQSLNQTLQLNISACPPFYSPYEDKCISVFTPFRVSWAEAKLFCASTLGSLIVLDDIHKYKQILDYLKENGIKSDFWIGGYANKTLEDVWMWNNEKTIQLGAPFWAITIDKSPQETSATTTRYDYNEYYYTTNSPLSPRCKSGCQYRKELLPQQEETNGRCLAMLRENHYYFSNEKCSKRMSPICIAPKILGVQSYEATIQV